MTTPSVKAQKLVENYGAHCVGVGHGLRPLVPTAYGHGTMLLNYIAELESGGRLAGEDERVVSKSSAGDGVWVPKKAWKVVGQIIKDLEHYGYNEDADLHHQLSRLAASALPIAPAAGEDEVVVKREEIETARRLAVGGLSPSRSGGRDLVELCRILGCWLAGSPTAQESKNG